MAVSNPSPRRHCEDEVRSNPDIDAGLLPHRFALSRNDGGDVTLVAASKQQSIEKIQSVIQSGLYRFGENYLQEAIPKIEYFKSQKINLEWHFIGHVQSNKTKEIANYFDWVQSVDSKKISGRLNAQRDVTLPPLNICIEINETGGTQKSGIKLNKLPELITYIQTLPHLKFRGLMTTVTEDYEKTAKAFQDLKKQGYNIDTLSMGMSQDYLMAIKLGATMVRLGTILFGKRQTS